jgi:hypothetical protein
VTHSAAEVQMAKPFQGTINLDIRDSTPDWSRAAVRAR